MKNYILLITLIFCFSFSAQASMEWHYMPVDTLKEDPFGGSKKAERQIEKAEKKYNKALSEKNEQAATNKKAKRAEKKSKDTASTSPPAVPKSKSSTGSGEGGGIKNKADNLYDDLGYMASAEHYEKLVADGKATQEVMAHLANSYRLNGDTETAEYWYSKFIGQTNNAKHILHYAMVLQSNLKCEDAVRWYKEYQDVSSDENRTFIENCSQLDQFKDNENVEVSLQDGLNTSHLDFSPIPYKNGVIFTSTRGTDRVAKRRDLWTDDNFTDLFFAEKSKDGDYKEATALIGDINGKFHDGVATFDKSGKTMYFTRSNKSGKSSEGLIDLKIYSATNEDGQWKNVQELPFNSDEYATCHPTLSPNGKVLYFSSNRPDDNPFGGMDIYYSKKVGNTWSTPKNMGPTVNSSGNETFPFISQDGQLYFASDGHRGFGGLDVFVTAKENMADENSWSLRENLGAKFNSPKDDFAFIVLEKDKKGFLTSNRNESTGGDDIFQWTMTEGTLKPKKKQAQERDFCVIDATTGLPVSGATVTVLPKGATAGLGQYDDLILTLKKLESSNNEYVLGISDRNALSANGDNIVTGEDGQFTYPMTPGEEYIFLIEKNKYDRYKESIATYSVLSSAKECFELKLNPRNCFLLEGLVKNKTYGTLIPFAEVQVFNKCTGEVFKTTSNDQGYFDYCLDCNCDYEITANKQYFKRGFTKFSTQNMDCPSPGVMSAVVELEPGELKDQFDNPNGIANPSGTPNPYGNPYDPNNPNNPYGPGFNPIQGPLTPEALRRYFLGDPNANFQVGQVITLHHIYYDFDKYYIRGDASMELDYLVALMKMYPSMEIAMESHTDSRGTIRYNRWLARKRAESSKDYLIEKGVGSYRINSATGMGENRLTNHCSDDVECTEEEHQRNRRTEIKVTKFVAPGVQVTDSQEVRR